MSQIQQDLADTAIAVVGMAGRFPGADDVDALWRQSAEGRTGVTEVDDRRPGMVPARGVVRDTDRFDAAFFGIPPHEARAMDPQQRVLLEVAQHAFDDAGTDASRAGTVAVYAACAPGPAVPTDEDISLAQRYELDLATAAEFAATRLSYRLGLRGESITVQTGCSSSLVAVHLACQSLWGGLSDMALAGGVSFAADQNSGYPSEEGMISSPTGGCRPFDATADGTVPGGGAGLVVLKRLADAQRDGDRVRAVILGSAANNDGQTKVGFMAPSPTGQSEAIATAHAMADVDAGSIGYVETHGTATKLGDAVEIEGLRKAFALSSETTGSAAFCALGSLKANCGHLDRAAGVAGLIRAVLALEHRTIPPMAGFESANPLLELDRSPFFVPTEALSWKRGPTPRRAGVSAFGVGGTNAHVVLQEAPDRAGRQTAGGPVLLPLSGHTSQAAEQVTAELARQLEKDPGHDIGAVAHTLITGRGVRRHRTFAVTGSKGQAVAALDAAPAAVPADDVSVVFAFPGQGEPVVDGLPGLYAGEPVFRATLDHCAEVVARRAGFDLRADLYESDPADRARLFSDMARFQPAMFAVEWAVAELWRSWGLTADAVLGHSLGEVVAATYAGVFEPDDGLAMIVERSSRMVLTRPGETVSVQLGAAEVERRLPEGVVIASVNGRELTTVAGPADAVAALTAGLAAEGVSFRRLHIPRAPHGPAMRPAADALTAFVERLPLTSPTLPILSNVTGGWLGKRLAAPEYWGTHLCSTVRFDAQLARLGELNRPLVVEVGPNTGLARMIAHEVGDTLSATVALAREGDARIAMLRAAGEAWSRGAAVRLEDLTALPATKVRLPATPFDHRRQWPVAATAAVRAHAAPLRHDDPGAWLYEPRFEPVPPTGIRTRGRLHWFGGGEKLRDACAAALRDENGTAAVADGLPAADDAPATDVIWCYEGPAGDLLQESAAVARTVAAHSPGARVWLLVPRDGDPAASVSVWDVAVAAARVAPQEFPGALWSVVALAGPPAASLARDLLEAVSLPEHRPVLEIGDGVRALGFERAWPQWKSRPMRAGGCYVITGGAGLVGRALAVAHAREVDATIVLLGRRATDEVTGELDPLRRELAGLGSRLEYRTVDVTRREELTRCFGELRARFGRIDGVTHAAGFTDRGDFVELEHADAAALSRIAAAKVDGLANLEAALTDEDADFVLLCSSLSTVLGGLRFAPYAAANVALDEAARLRHARGDRRWISVAWDGWSQTGAGPEGPARYALGPDDGHEVFRRVLAVRGPLVYVSTGELYRRIAEVGEQLGIRDGGGEPSRGATTDPEQAVAAVLTEVLGAVPSDPLRDLRADGLESLTLLQIVTRLGSLLGVRLSLGAALRSLTVTGLRELAANALGEDTGEQDSALPEPFTIDPVPARDNYPVSSTQRRWLTLLDQGYGGLDLAVDVAGDVTAAQLAAAVRTVVERHSGLRSTFHLADGEWRQRVRPAGEIPVVDLSGLSKNACADAFARLRETTAARPLDVSAAPPFEVAVVTLREGRKALLVHAHHVLFDGWSSSMFLRDVAGAVRGELGPPPLQYVDFAVAQQAAGTSPEFLRRREYWRRHFDGAPAPTRVTPDHLAADQDDRGEVIEFTLADGLAEALRRRAEAEHTTAFTFMMAAYAVLLHELTGETDLVVGTTAAGRTPVRTEEIVGVFVNPLPLRLTVDPHAPARELIRSVHHALVGFHEHGSYPMEDLVTAVEPFVGKGLNDTFHCYLLYQNYWRPESEDLAFRALEAPASTHHKLMREFEIVLAEGPQGLGGELWYLPSRFHARSAEAWRERYVLLLEQLGRGAESLDLPLSSLGGAAPGTGGQR